VPALAVSGDRGWQESLGAEEAFNPDGLVPRVVSELKRRFPDLGVITDVALDPYTSSVRMVLSTQTVMCSMMRRSKCLPVKPCVILRQGLTWLRRRT
jgi:delta-aminolevulinic acid dehydratase/porphobilinogen synthase